MRPKIAFYLHAITDGGQCKVLLDLASGLAERGYDVTFIHDIIINDIFLKNTSDKLNFLHMKLEGKQSGIIHPHLKSIKPLKKAINRVTPDIIISGGNLNNCIVILAKEISKTKPKVIITEHADLTSILKTTNKIKAKIISHLMRFCYPKADYIAAVSQGVAKDLSFNLKMDLAKVNVLYNPVINEKFYKLKELPVEHPWILNKKVPVIICIGRLSYQKDYFNMIDAFNLFLKKYDANLLILGEGEDRFALQKYINDLKIANKVDMIGRVSNPYAYLSKSDLFVLSSRWEGLPTVIIEALGCNTPIVSTDCPHGPREILENGKWGRLVPIENPKLLSEAILDFFLNPNSKSTISRANDFSYTKTISQYIEVIENLSNV